LGNLRVVDWFSAPGSWLARLVVQRSIGVIYLIAFLVALNQFRALLGEEGLMPVPRFLRRRSFRQAPSLFHVHYSDRLLVGVSTVGAVLAATIVAGLPDHWPLGVSIAIWFVLWALYLSIVNVGQTFYAFGWESLLLEAGFLAVFLGPAHVAPPVLTIWLMRWLVFRVEFGAGLIKLRGDDCWRDLTCLYYHHETQPMPNPLSRRFHQLPKIAHRTEVLGNHFAQLVVPFGLFAPQPVASISASIIIVTQCWLVLSGNFAWLNAITIALAASGFGDGVLHHVLSISQPVQHVAPTWFEAVVIAMTVIVGYLSYWPVRNLLARRQRMNASFNSLHLVNTYGAFGSITRHRDEIVIEGSAQLHDPAEWKEYEFKGKPGDPRRRPPQVAPYHLRLDWLMWFAALSPGYADPWFEPFIVKLLQNDKATLKLLRSNPFPDAPPARIRARTYRYRFATSSERRESGVFWVRTLIGEYLPTVALRQGADTGATTQLGRR
jgi:hypothetical protein